MAQFRTTADLVDLVLINAGEVTSGTSTYESQVLNYLNKVHLAIVAGGTIPLIKDQSIDINEIWPWARAQRPLVIELQPKYDTGTVTLTLGSEAGTFSAAPSYSVAGWFLKVIGRDEWFRIASHTASATAFELDGDYTDVSGSLSFEVVKLDYTLVPEHIVIDSTNNKLDFKKASGGSILTATLTSGAYTPSELATHVGTQMTAAAGGPTITASYSSTTRLFTITSDGAAMTTLLPLFATGTNQTFSAHKTLGFDDSDPAAALTHTATYTLGGIVRLVEPMKVHRGTNLDGSIYGVDGETFQRNYPFTLICEGVPDRFTVIKESFDGTLTVRFNKYSTEKTRVEVEHVPFPRDLKDNAGSIPIIPRKYVDVLEDAGTFYLMVNKSDDRAQLYANMVQSKLSAMISQHRGTLAKTGKNFGQSIPRPDLLRASRKKLIYGGNT